MGDPSLRDAHCRKGAYRVRVQFRKEGKPVHDHQHDPDDGGESLEDLHTEFVVDAPGFSATEQVNATRFP